MLPLFTALPGGREMVAVPKNRAILSRRDRRIVGRRQEEMIRVGEGRA